MSKKLFEIIGWWLVTGIFVVLGRRLLRYGLSMDIFKNDFISELILGTLIAIIIGVICDRKN